MKNLFKRAMPWLGEEICIMDAQSHNTIMPGLSLVQWMNMQNNPSLNPNMQPDYMRSLTGPSIQNLGASDLSKQLALQSQLLQQNIQFNAPRLPQQPQQVDQPSKVFVPLNQIGTVTRPHQQMQDTALQQRHQLANQTVPLNQSQTNLMKPQTLMQNQLQQQQLAMQNQHQVQNNLQSNHAQQYQQLLFQKEQQQQQVQQQQQIQQQQQMQQHQQFQQQQLQENFMHAQLSNQTNQQLQLPEHQIQLELLHKLQQRQQQSFLSQSTQQLPPLSQIQDPQRTILDATHQIPNSDPPRQQQVVPQQCAKHTSPNTWLPQSSQPPSQQKLQQQQVLLSELPGTALHATPTSLLSTNGRFFMAANGTRSGLTDDVPSCSPSSMTDNCAVLPQPMLNKAQHCSALMTDKTSQSAGLDPSSFEAQAADQNVVKEFPKSEQNVKYPTPIPKVQIRGINTPQPQTYISNTAQLDYLDTSSSATSACLSQTDGPLQQRLPFTSFSQLVFRDAPPDSGVQGTDLRNNVLFRDNDEDTLGIPLITNPLLANTIDSGKYQNISENVVAGYSPSKDVQQELSSSIVSQSFGLPELAFNSIDSTIDDSSFLNKSSWAPAPQFQRMRTYTKVYKRGAVGRSIDMARYSDYDELKHDLARMFSIEGQLEDRKRVGWKLVYVDHENDVLLVGDDPWEEFVNCVRCIRILSQQEVQQMRLDGDLGSNSLPNQACSSSDGGNAWRGQCVQNSGNHSAGSYDHLE